GVLQLSRGTPALGGPLLEDADRVQVAEAQVLQLGLLHRGGVGDGQRLAWQVLADRDAGDGGGDRSLPEIELQRGGPGPGLAAGDGEQPVEVLVGRIGRIATAAEQHGQHGEHYKRAAPRGALRAAARLSAPRSGRRHTFDGTWVSGRSLPRRGYSWGMTPWT